MQLQAQLVNGEIIGTVCSSDAMAVNLTLEVAGRTAGLARTERLTPVDDVCYAASAHAGFVLPVPPEVQDALAANGATLRFSMDAPGVTGSVEIPARSLSLPRMQISKNDQDGVWGLYCIEEGTPELRGAFGQQPMSARIGFTQKSLADCKSPAAFAFPENEVAEWRSAQGVLTSESVQVWTGRVLNNARATAHLALKAQPVRLGLPIVEGNVKDPAILDHQWIALDAPMLFFEAMGLSPYEQGRRQGSLSAELRALYMQSWARFNPTDANKLLLPDWRTQLSEFKRGYEDGSGGRLPELVYTVDEPFSTNDGWTQSFNAERSHAMANAIDQMIDVYRATFPGVKLATALPPGLLFRDDIKVDALRTLAKFDIVAFDPYITYAMAPLHTTDVPARHLQASGTCPANSFERVDNYLTRCATLALHAANPNIKFAWLPQAFGVLDIADGASSAHRDDSLRRQWRAMSGLAYQSRSIGAGVGGFGWHMDKDYMDAEPNLVTGENLANAAALLPELIESLGKAP